MKIYLNGKLVEKQEVEEVFEPGFLFGWGAFETLRAYNKKVIFLEEHLKRLKQGLDFLGLSLPEVCPEPDPPAAQQYGVSPARLNFKKEIDNLLSENNLDNAYVRVTVYKKRKSTGLSIYTDKFDYYKEDTYQKGFTAILAPFARYSKDPFLKVKSISYAKSRLAWNLAQKQGKDEAVFLNEEGFIQEGSRSNLFFVKDNTVFTPSLECGLLEGVTRNKVIYICKRENIEVEEGRFGKEDLLGADEAFITSSLMEVMPLVECAGKPVNNAMPGPLTQKIHSSYKDIIR